MAEAIASWPAPESEVPSPDYRLEADGVPIFVYTARVRAEILKGNGLWTHERDCRGERASFAIFDITRPVSITVRPTRKFQNAVVLPHRSDIRTEIKDGTIQFQIEKAQHCTLVIDGDHRSALHLFIGEPEVNPPKPDDPDVVYFGPGVHELESLQVKSGQTGYLAGGSIVRGKLKPGEKGEFSEKWNVTFFGGTVVNVDNAVNVRICGRGILDGQLIPHPGRNLVRIHRANNVRISGIVLRDAPNWNVLIHQSHDVQVEDVRIISGRLNSDGINSVNSQRVNIRKCFVRNSDDSIVAKTTEPGAPCEAIYVDSCQIWNDWGFALGATYETRAPIRDVRFTDCSILFAAHFCLGIHVSDSATVSDIAFRRIEIAQTERNPAFEGSRPTLTPEPKLLRMAITQDVWGNDLQRGKITNVDVDDIVIFGPMISSDLNGCDEEHCISNLRISNVTRDGQPAIGDISALQLKMNAFVRDIKFTPK